jgi:hypothetical protein
LITEQTDHFRAVPHTLSGKKTGLEFVPARPRRFLQQDGGPFFQQMKVLRLIIGFIIILSISTC